MHNILSNTVVNIVPVAIHGYRTVFKMMSKKERKKKIKKEKQTTLKCNATHLPNLVFTTCLSLEKNI